MANSLHGLLNDTPGAIRVLTVMCVWPIAYTVLSTLMNANYALEYINRTLVFCLLLLIFYSFLYLGHVANVVPDFLYFELDQGQAVGFYSGYIEYNLYSISSLLFLLPYFAHCIYIKSQNCVTTNSSLLLIGAGVILSIATGRRAVILVVLLIPFIIAASQLITRAFGKIYFITILRFMKYNWLALLIIGILSSYCFFSIGITFDAVAEMFVEGFSFQGDDGSPDERNVQFHSLINAWQNGNLLFGSGNGSATDVVRSYEMKWAYELTYIYLLFSNGIVGVIVYVLWYAWGLFRIRFKLLARPELAHLVLPIISGSFGMLIGAASNPYVGKFDYLWIVMLPHLLAGCLKYQYNLPTEAHHR